VALVADTPNKTEDPTLAISLKDVVVQEGVGAGGVRAVIVKVLLAVVADPIPPD
jgi:hypothetical protein